MKFCLWTVENLPKENFKKCWQCDKWLCCTPHPNANIADNGGSWTDAKKRWHSQPRSRKALTLDSRKTHWTTLTHNVTATETGICLHYMREVISKTSIRYNAKHRTQVYFWQSTSAIWVTRRCIDLTHMARDSTCVYTMSLELDRYDGDSHRAKTSTRRSAGDRAASRSIQKNHVWSRNFEYVIVIVLCVSLAKSTAHVSEGRFRIALFYIDPMVVTQWTHRKKMQTLVDFALGILRINVSHCARYTFSNVALCVNNIDWAQHARCVGDRFFKPSRCIVSIFNDT